MLLIYGATGYTGTLIAEACAARSIAATLAGRSEGPLRALADRLRLPYVIAALDDATALDRALVDVRAVLHCAGPFAETSRAMVDACLRTRRHYLDITGELAVFRACAARDGEAKAAGVMLLPGAGFDVVPSDCLAAHAKTRMPDAKKLRICLATRGSMSHGTASTVVTQIIHQGAVRKNGVLVPERVAKRERKFDVGARSVTAVSLPLGDLETAYWSTGIGDIETFTALPRNARIGARFVVPLVAPLLRVGVVEDLVRARIKTGGPSEAQRARGSAVIVAEVEDASGRVLASRLQTPDGYAHTVESALAAAARAVAGEAPAGFRTPATAYGADFVLPLPGVTRIDA